MWQSTLSFLKKTLVMEREAWERWDLLSDQGPRAGNMRETVYMEGS